ncbi:Endo-1,4-beta-xylanase, glycosyl hydrolase family 10 [Halorhabdus sp. SVX81]|uniref:endo-1,4-beta-xylanase n=1 Tax=Halorhabdus sp. SVX81 TaxID=2978283 RepID=UPI0023DB7679|nr:endo-1,4-beta-xylanase [Halorhabdus sp. SVX81]WEL16643.1 Endo-1,4-beta-xylanase, glycosyl hydrolase family 10 [Halorhabdus sp. SVX81]
MNDDGDSHSDRRTFLKSIGALGASTAVGTGAIGSVTADEHLDQYHRTLREELTDERGLPAGEFVYGGTEKAPLDAFSHNGGEGGTETEMDVSADDVPITIADRLQVTETPENAYAYTYKGSIDDRSFSQGDVLLGVAYLRGVDTASADAEVQTQAGFKWEYTNPDGSTGYSSNMVVSPANISPGSSWERHYFVVEIGEKPDGSEFQPFFEFWTGFTAQTIDFGGMALIDYSDTDVTAGRLNELLVSYDYDGRGADAQWRQAAHDRIEKIRKTDVEVEVLDGDGNAVADADVEVAMAEHAFDFGGEFTLSQIGDRWDSDVAETYRRTWLENFNKGVLTNALKVSPWSGEWGEAVNADTARRAIQWLLDNDVPTRGHALVWEEWDWMNIDADQSDAAINDLVTERIRTRASEFRGDFVEWDMHNHPIWQPNIREQIGREAALEWWQTAHDAAPDAQMYVNEMNIIAGSSYRDPYDEFITWLMDNDAGVEGIGFMGHFDITNLTPPAELLSVFDRFGEHGVPLQITEFDVQMDSRDDEAKVEAQADYVRDVLTAAFSHKAVEGVMSWCFWDESGEPKRYYSEDWTLRPHGEEYQRLVFEEWWTEESGTTDGDGVYATDGFKGTYTITATDGDQTAERAVEIGDDTGTVTVTLGESDAGGGQKDDSDDETETPPGALPGGEGPPQDLDGDGRHEDVDGDGDADIADLRSLLNNRDSGMVQENAGAYDFDGDGDVDAGDVLALFRQLYR